MDRHRRALIALAPVAFVALFFAWPVARIVGRGLWPGGDVDLRPLGSVLTDPHLRTVVWFTVWQAVASTALTLVVGLPVAAVLARFEFPGRRLAHALVIVPFVLPTVVVGSAFLALLGPDGLAAPLGLADTVGAILLAHVFFNVAVVVWTVGALWGHLDGRREEAARTLGATRAQTFVHVTLPALRPAIVAAATIVFLFTFTSFGVILVLGGPGRSTLETEIYRQTAQLLHLRTAAALSVVQLVAVLALLGLTALARGRDRVALGLAPGAANRRRPRTTGERVFVGGVLAGAAVLLGAPIAVLVQRSLETADGGIGLGSYRALGSLGSSGTLLVPPTTAIRNSLEFAATATVIALAVGVVAAIAIVDAERHGGRLARAIDGFLALPLGVSAVTVGFGFLVAFAAPPLDLRTSWWIVPIAQALVATPFVVRTVVPVLRGIDPHLREVAAVLGAPPRRVWREVDLRIGARAVAVAAGFAFAISLGEFGATAFIARPDRPTLPVVIYRLLSRPDPDAFGVAMAASVVLVTLTVVSVLAIERLRAPGSEV